MTWTRLDQDVLIAVAGALGDDPLNKELRARYHALDARRDRESPGCPQCGTSMYVQKCPFDLGGYCPRHDALEEWEDSLS